MNPKYLALMLLAGCGPEVPDHWEVSGVTPAHLEEALAVAREHAPCDVGPWGGKIEFVSDYFMCGDSGASGCTTWHGAVPTVRVVTGTDALDTALIHELGHVAWDRCGKENASHPLAFVAWIFDTQMALVVAER